MKNELDMALTEITVKIVSTRGHDEETMPAASALEFIQAQCRDAGKWCFLGTNHVDPNDITIDDLVHAEGITLTNMLVGG